MPLRKKMFFFTVLYLSYTILLNLNHTIH